MATGVRIDRSLTAGTRFGSYTVLECLGRGATATVYECSHDPLGRRVAVKLLHAHLAGDPVVCARLLREGRALSRLRHPNIVDVYDVGEIDGVPYLVMSVIEGHDLGDHIRLLFPMGITDVVDCTLPIVDALSFAHRAGIVHRDLKPSNIRLTRDHCGNVVPKVLDFGVSKFVSGAAESDLTETNGHLGTASYMAPEQIRSARTVDPRADVYAVGVILYEALTGQRPFRGQSGYEIMHAVLTAPVAPPRLLRPDVPSELDAIVMRAMHRDPARRYGSAPELGLALAPFASNPTTWLEAFRGRSAPPSAAPREPPSSTEPSCTMASRAPLTRRPLRWLRVAVGTFVVGAVFAGLNVRAMPSSPPAASSPLLSETPIAQAPMVRAVTPPLLSPSSAWGSAATTGHDGLVADPAPVGAAVSNVRAASRARKDPGRDVTAPRLQAVVTKEFGTNGSPILE